MRRRQEWSIEVKTPAQLALMREAGLVVARGLAEMSAAARPGASTGDLDEIGRAVQEEDRRVGLSTVYRSLKLFVEAGLAREHHFLAGKTRFAAGVCHQYRPKSRPGLAAPCARARTNL